MHANRSSGEKTAMRGRIFRNASSYISITIIIHHTQFFIPFIHKIIIKILYSTVLYILNEILNEIWVFTYIVMHTVRTV